jgi:hypothetical protein
VLNCFATAVDTPKHSKDGCCLNDHLDCHSSRRLLSFLERVIALADAVLVDDALALFQDALVTSLPFALFFAILTSLLSQFNHKFACASKHSNLALGDCLLCS